MTTETPAHRRDEYLTHRLQAFSDIVMGFSLAQLALSLVIPTRAAELWMYRPWLVAYLWTFGVIGGIWSGPTRLFRYVFVPTPVDVIVNFIMLASLGLSVYFVQVYMHLTQHISDLLIVGRSYFTTFGIVLVCFGIMYAISLRHEPEAIPPEEIQKAVKGRARTSCMGAGVLVGVAASFCVSREYSIMAIVAGFVGGAITARVLTRLALGASPRALSRDTT